MQRSESCHHRRRLPHIDFDVRRTSQCCPATLHQEITVTGAEANHKCIYFTIKSTAERRGYIVIMHIIVAFCGIYPVGITQLVKTPVLYYFVCSYFHSFSEMSK